jgi:hypothetical protein
LYRAYIGFLPLIVSTTFAFKRKKFGESDSVTLRFRSLRNMNGLSTTINMAMKRMSFGVKGQAPVASLDTLQVLPRTGGKVAPADDQDV